MWLMEFIIGLASIIGVVIFLSWYYFIIVF